MRDKVMVVAGCPEPQAYALQQQTGIILLDTATTMPAHAEAAISSDVSKYARLLMVYAEVFTVGEKV